MAVLVIAGVLAGLIVPDMARLSWLIGETRMLSMVAGGCIGALFAQLLFLQRRVRTLEKRLDDQHDADMGPSQRPGTDAPPKEAAEKPLDRPAYASAAVAPQEPVQARTQPTAQAGSASDRNMFRTASSRFQHWLTDGNLPVKAGVLVLFVGVAALLRHVIDQGWLAVGIEWRLSAVALVAIGALIFAWRERHGRRVFSLSLQGGAIGVLALVVFAAFRLYEVLPALPAFAMLILLTFATTVLAVMQAALVLAVLAVIAGFAAPLLIATDAGNHLVLFGWYALLNLGIFAIAWRQSWPLLNRIGFAFTFIIGSAWGVLNYSSELYGGTQAFLPLFFALYFLIPVFHAVRKGAASCRLPDVVLVFGLPLFAFPLQAGLLEGERIPIAFSALALALIYLAGAFYLLRVRPHPALGRSHAVLAIGFATLAVPFAFAAPTVSMIWALQGAALVWFGISFQHRASRLAGLALQSVAALVWCYVLVSYRHPELAVLNEVFLGGLAVSAALTISAWRYDLAAASSKLINSLALLALSIWLLNGLVEIDRQVSWPLTPDLWLLYAGMTAIICALFHEQRRWEVPGWAAGLLLMAGVPLAFAQTDPPHWPLGGLGSLVWLLFIVSAWMAQHHLREAREQIRAMASLAIHASAVTLLTASAIHLAREVFDLAEGWQWLGGALPLYLMLGWLMLSGRPPLSPGAFAAPADSWLRGIAGSALVLGLLASISSSGDSAPLPFVPALNPLEIAQIAGLIVLAILVRQSRPPQAGLFWLGLLAFLLFTWMIFRGVHQLGDIRWSIDAILASRVGQASLSIGWTTLAVIAWVSGSRTGHRGLWLVGAVLLSVVLIKLMLIDRTFLSTMAGIVSFLAFGLLSILVGYLAPAPPRGSPEFRGESDTTMQTGADR
jgi:uncharacterized membrane protein